MTSTIDVQFEEAAQAVRVGALPMSHLSIELGHLYPDDLGQGRKRLVEIARQMAPWVRAAQESFVARAHVVGRLRASTCLLIDDYFMPVSTPGELIPMIMDAYAEAGLTIDYIAREAGCAVADTVPVADIVKGSLVVDPTPGTDGTRPPVDESGWLANGVRSPSGGAPAMSLGDGPGQRSWQAPVQNSANRHSVFVDVQLWEDGTDGRVWSCPFLATAWQLMRLGLLRYQGGPVVQAVAYDRARLESWDAFPALVQMSPNHPAPFAAYCTFSALSTQYLGIEHAVRTILGQFAVQPDVEKQIYDRINEEDLRLPTGRTIDRVDYAFLGPIW